MIFNFVLYESLIHLNEISVKLPNISNRGDISDVNLKQYDMNDEQRLFKRIIRNYDISVRPVWNASTVVNVYMGLTLTHIFNVVMISTFLNFNLNDVEDDDNTSFTRTKI